MVALLNTGEGFNVKINCSSSVKGAFIRRMSQIYYYQLEVMLLQGVTNNTVFKFSNVEIKLFVQISEIEFQNKNIDKLFFVLR